MPPEEEAHLKTAGTLNDSSRNKKDAVDGDRKSVGSSRGVGRPTDLVDVVRQDGVVSQALLKPPLVQSTESVGFQKTSLFIRQRREMRSGRRGLKRLGSAFRRLFGYGYMRCHGFPPSGNVRANQFRWCRLSTIN
jgi:hypothetical protein